MAKIKRSSKLSSDEDEQCVYSGSFVFFRIVAEGDQFKFMTATACEDTGEFRPFHDQHRLIAATMSVLLELGKEWVNKDDWAGRPYVEVRFAAGDDVLHIVHAVLLSLGFDDFDVSLLREMRALHEEFAVDDTSEDAYLSDGMWVTADGRLVNR